MEPMPFPDVDAIVIGASAGGVEALQRLLGSLPAGLAPAVLVVLHLPRETSGSLPQVLGRRCALPVLEALDKQPLAGGSVVLAPAGYHLLVERERTLALSVDPPVLHSRPAIDPLFESAALVYGARLLALLLTGASRDGSEGLAAVRRHGGTAWVQDPATAVASTMPASALAHAGADAVLSLDEISLRLSRAKVR
ncbi:chemotaxis protein CheB [Caldimonas tepidiphila]|uniref:chemotaxis protein CheB n=1 Tax=Caldimonas tepidiphila TaxID=2315841 RepID=UPI000E5B9FFE|nr:chemotaxis protein CheB [Caldimonas tepidiphila]